jgi:hypothetical protein
MPVRKVATAARNDHKPGVEPIRQRLLSDQTARK